MHKIRLRLFISLFCAVLSATAFGQVKPVKPVPDSVAEEAKETDLDNIPIVSLDDNDGEDGSAQNIAGQLSAGKNPYLDAANFHFSAVRYRVRGYDADLNATYMNGIQMENLDNGFTPYGLWGGLNDVLRNRDVMLGMGAENYGIGGIGGATNYDTRAYRQYKQTKIGYSYSNRTYTHRFSLTKSTGWNKKGWAFSGSMSRRWADEGFADGTYYDGWSFYAGVDKKINAKQTLSFVAFATPTENGRQGASVQEMDNIAGTNFYNPYWGYQNGKKRNASVAKTFQPFGILTHDWKINPRTSVVTAASYELGNRSTTSLDWYNAADPRPDYYRYLPSYQEDPAVAAQVLAALQSDVNLRQINWDKLYQTNYSSYGSVQNANGIAGNTVSGKRSSYVLQEAVVHTNKISASSTLNATLTSHISFTGRINYENQRNNYYKKLDDLLGGDFYVDVDQFAERDFPSNTDAAQNDLNHPNRILHVGDKFGYNYNINVQKASAFAQANVKFNKINFFIGAQHSYTQFYRVGYVRNGENPTTSYGESAKQNFYNYNVKGGISYKPFSGHYFFANGSYQTKAPFYGSAFISPRTRNTVQDNLRSEQIGSVEAGYVYNSPNVRLRATGYYTQFRHGTSLISGYSDIYRTYVDYALNNIGHTHQGVEFGAEVKVYKGLTVNAAAGIGSYMYDTRQNLTVTADNNSAISVPTDNLVYVKNFRVPTPQTAYSLGFNYRSPKYWYVSLNGNYFDQMWLGFDPLRRTTSAVEGIDPKDPLYTEIIDQTRLKKQFSLDGSAGYSWLISNSLKGLHKRTFLTFSFNVNNILNNKDIVSGGFEQLRFDTGNLDKYSPKLFYAYGLNFSANVALRF